MMLQNFLFQTPTEWAILALLFVAGLMFGFAGAPGGRKWRERYQDEEIEHAAYRHRAENDLKESNRRVRDLETERDRLKKELDESQAAAASAAAATAAATAAAASAPPAPVAEEPGAGWRGWFGWGRDNLSRVKGIDEAREKRLNELGIKTYREIEKMTADDETALEQRLGMEAGAIAREQWREQAALLRAGNEDEHAKRFG